MFSFEIKQQTNKLSILKCPILHLPIARWSCLCAISVINRNCKNVELKVEIQLLSLKVLSIDKIREQHGVTDFSNILLNPNSVVRK